jgi:ABC-2 type transport system permease protein
MRKILAVIRREFVERVRTKTFILSTVLGPLFFGAMAIIPGLLLSRQTTGQRIGVIDGTANGFGTRISEALSATMLGKGSAAKALYAPIRIEAAGRVKLVIDSLVPMTALSKGDGASFDGLLIVGEDVLSTGKLRYYGKNVGSLGDMGQLKESLTASLWGRP